MLLFEWQLLSYDGRVQSLMAKGPPDIFLNNCAPTLHLHLTIEHVLRQTATHRHWNDSLERVDHVLPQLAVKVNIPADQI